MATAWEDTATMMAMMEVAIGGGAAYVDITIQIEICCQKLTYTTTDRTRRALRHRSRHLPRRRRLSTVWLLPRPATHAQGSRTAAIPSLARQTPIRSSRHAASRPAPPKHLFHAELRSASACVQSLGCATAVPAPRGRIEGHGGPERTLSWS